MTQNEKSEFAALLAGVFSLYRQTTSDFIITAFWNSCLRYDIDQVRDALNAHVMDPEGGQFPPKPADIVKQLQGTHGDRALIAWSKAFDAVKGVGPYQSVQFDDGVIHAVIEDMGGWVQLSKLTYDELSYFQKRFCDQYRAHSRRPTVHYPDHLAGITEIENKSAKLPYPPPKPVLIGDPTVAARVALGAYSGRKTGNSGVTALVESIATRIPKPESP